MLYQLPRAFRIYDKTAEHMRRPRRYTPKACAVCKGEAFIAINVTGRTVGRGQDQARRKTARSSTVHLCRACANQGRYKQLLTEALEREFQTSIPFQLGE